jgi:hypothetical protein
MAENNQNGNNQNQDFEFSQDAFVLDNLPGGDEPKDDQPRDDEPKNDEPKDDQPKDDQPKDDEPKDDKPKNDKPKDDQPKEPDNPFDIDDTEKKTYPESVSGVNYESLSKKLDIEIDDNVNEDVFVDKVNEKLKEVAKYDVSKLTPLQKQFFERIEEDPESIPNLLNNDKISQFNTYLNSPVESRYKEVRAYELKQKGVDAEDIAETIEDELSEKTEADLKKAIRGTDNEIKKLKRQEFENILKEENDARGGIQSKNQEQIKKEREKIASKVDDISEFMGFEIPPQRRNILKNKIKNGEFDSEMSNADPEKKIKAYYAMNYYDRVNEQAKKMLKAKDIEGHEKGMQKMIEVFHNVRPAGDGSGGSRQAQEPNRKNVGGDKPAFSNDELLGA